MEGVADVHVHCWKMGSDHTHCRGRGQEIGQSVWSPGAGPELHPRPSLAWPAAAPW